MNKTLIYLISIGIFFLTACQSSVPSSVEKKQQNEPISKEGPPKAHILQKYHPLTPNEWGEQVTGVKQRLHTDQKVVALTFDACGGPNGNQYDKELVHYLIKNKIPSTLFINSRWIDANRSIFLELANNPLFEIENHGTHHQPLSVNGKSVYGIPGTKNIQEVIDEVLHNHQRITNLTGKSPQYFRSGTAFYDEIAVQIVNDLGMQVVNFDIVGDAGATYTKEQVKASLLQVKPGSIVLLHMNQPASETLEGLAKAIPILKNKGYQFVKLKDFPLE